MRTEDDSLLLVDKLKGGDQQAMKQIFVRFHEEIYRSIYRLVQDHQICEDLTQEVFLNIWKKRSTLKIKDNLGGYLHTMAYHEAMGFFRRRRKEEPLSNEYDTVAQDGYDRINEMELEDRIKFALDELPLRCRSIFLLSRFEGRSYREIADMLDISIKTVENQMVKALRILRHELADYLAIIVLVTAFTIFFGLA